MVIDLLILFGLHYFSDFLLQGRSMGKGKVSNPYWMGGHWAIIFLPLLLGGFFLAKESLNGPVGPFNILTLALCISFLHCAQDWLIWSLYKMSIKIRLRNKYKVLDSSNKDIAIEYRDWEYWDDKWFFNTIGIDQLLHYATIILVYNII